MDNAEAYVVGNWQRCWTWNSFVVEIVAKTIGLFMHCKHGKSFFLILYVIPIWHAAYYIY